MVFYKLHFYVSECVPLLSYNSYLEPIWNFRALDVNTLIGNIGGYVGLLIGVSISDFPILVQQISQKSQKIFEMGKNLLKNKRNLSG